MNVRFVSQDSAWTESKKAFVKRRIVDPLIKLNLSVDAEICFLLEITWRKRPQLTPIYSMWAVTQPGSGGSNKIYRRDGSKFEDVVDEIFGDMLREWPSPNVVARLSARLFGN